MAFYTEYLRSRCNLLQFAVISPQIFVSCLPSAASVIAVPLLFLCFTTQYHSFHFHNFRLPNSEFRRIRFALKARTACNVKRHSVTTCCSAAFLFVIRCKSSPLTLVAMIARFLHIIYIRSRFACQTSCHLI